MDVNQRLKLTAAACCALATLLAGCVVNPYVRSTSKPLQADSTVCGTTEHRDALKYATCLRRVMEDKASRYAVMNNGGGAFLLGVTGLAAYRGLRGGHEANVAALTAGGAALYGTQQYLYRQPREVIYWSGVNALGCAISLTEKRLIQVPEANTVRQLLDKTVSVASDDVATLSARLGRVPATCGKIQAQQVRAERLVVRKLLLQQRVQRLEAWSREAEVDLLSATDAIVGSVNAQLAREQPDPAGLATLVAQMKLPALAPTKTLGDAEKQKGDGQSTSSEAFKGAAETSCLAFTIVSSDLEAAMARLERNLDSLQAALESAEAQAGLTGGAEQALDDCYRPPELALLPFTLQLPRDGIVKVKAGTSTTLGITGGTAPYSGMPTSRAEELQITQVPGVKPALQVSAIATAASGGVAVLAMDAAGHPQMFQVQIEAKEP